MKCVCVFFQAEDGIRDLVRSRGLGDVYKRQAQRNRTEFYKLLQRHNLTPALFKAEKEKA